MVFSSITFLLYFLPTVFIVYYILSFSRRLQNIWLLIASLFFYAWGEPLYVLLMIASIIFNYVMGLIVGRIEAPTKKKIALAIGCVGDLSVLFVFKYSAWIVGMINSAFEADVLPVPELSLPIGISFYTFQALSYIIDVYRKKAKPQKNLLNLGLYISFFPQLVAGPIVRYTTIEKQLKDRKSDFTKIAEGCCRFSEGLAKKILISNNLAVIADNIFGLNVYGDTTKTVPAMLAWLGAIAYTLQLYYDFSGYSDMAIGLGKIFGFNFPENFRYPFTSKSIREFMSKWHMTLTGWFNNYVYKPLGGSQGVNRDKMVRNLLIVWVLTGIWHGADWTYLYWGLWLFVFILFENIIEIDKVEGFSKLRHVYVILVIVFSMVIFKSTDSAQLVLYTRDLFGLAGNGFYSATAVMFVKEYWLVLLFAILFLFPIKNTVLNLIDDGKCPKAVARVGNVLYVIAMPMLLFLCLVILAKGGYNPFIYFEF